MVTHGNLAHNLGTMLRGITRMPEAGVCVSWMPQYHDFGERTFVQQYHGPSVWLGKCAFLRPDAAFTAPQGQQTRHMPGVMPQLAAGSNMGAAAMPCI